MRERCGTIGMVVIKDPNGSIGAPLISEAIPESRVILMMRDPRDIVASSFDGKRPGGWQNPDGAKFDFDDPLKFAQVLTKNTVNRMKAFVAAFDAHHGPRSAVRYEDLVADTTGTMARMLDELEIPFSEEKLATAAAKLVFDNMPETMRGPGKRFRKGVPGSYHEDLTPDQLEIVERLGKGLLSRFYVEST